MYVLYSKPSNEDRIWTQVGEFVLESEAREEAVALERYYIARNFETLETAVEFEPDGDLI